jgi:hypothetical protein
MPLDPLPSTTPPSSPRAGDKSGKRSREEEKRLRAEEKAAAEAKEREESEKREASEALESSRAALEAERQQLLLELAQVTCVFRIHHTRLSL